VTVSAPPALNAPDTVAVAEAAAIVTATAAATDTGPPDVDAKGVVVELEPEPPAAVEWLFAFVRSPATWPSTPPDGAADDVPAADAVAVPFVELDPFAVTLAAPPTVSGRALDAVTTFVASFTVTAAPIAAVDACAPPVAVVVADAVCVAETTSAPPSVVGPPVPIDAVVVTVDSETATAGATPTPPPDEPDSAAVVIVFVLVA
jgi:hypothetical protein